MLKQHILGVIGDLVADFLYYDRKDDEGLELGVIEQAVKSGEITIEEMTQTFKEALEKRCQ
ncbi:MAG: hypothetical protein PHF86_10945 [Candidatus Nanoarchaeia archaeon]|jgi:hypothetical protein|nr:hypothetical protein [Candidatus Nanoarchaeia archaeon]